MENTATNTANALLPPRSKANAGKEVFCERRVVMRGVHYYFRQFRDGNSEFAAFDAAAKKWVFLCFPPD
jgi:hypothetical protein